MSWFQKKQEPQNDCANNCVISTPHRPEAALLDTALNLLSYLLVAGRKKEELILPELTEYYGGGATGFYARDYIRTEDLHNWMNLVQRKQKEAADRKELTEKVAAILEKEYGIKPKAKNSAK